MLYRYDGTPRLYAYFMEYDTLDRPLDIARIDAKHDAVGVPEISFENFRNDVLPSLRKKLASVKIASIDAAVNVVYAACVKQKVIVNGCFADFQSSPSKIKTDSKIDVSEDSPKVNEDTIYAPLETLWEKILEIAKKELRLNPSIVFNHTPHAHPHMEREEAVRPDALSIVIESKMPDKFDQSSVYFFCNAAILKEDKIFNSVKNLLENLGKSLLNCNIVFANDPLRRGLYSLTSEDDKLRIWFFCRSGGVVSKPLDWIQDVKEFIGVILRLSFASHTALGFDESITRFWINKTNAKTKKEVYDKNLQYRIVVGLERFRTVGEPLSDRSANFFAGHGTRMFAAYETDIQWNDVTNGEPKYTVKIYWPKKGSILEGELIKELLAKAARKKDSTSWIPIVKVAAIVKIEDAEIPDPSDDSLAVPDETTQFVRVKLNNKTCDFYPGPMNVKGRRSGTNSIKGSARLQSTGGLQTAARMDSVTGISSNDYVNPNIEDFLAVFWVERVQYRIVFEGIGEPLDKLTSMYDIFLALRDGFQAVRKLHEYGYIHRNIGIKSFRAFRGLNKAPWTLQLTDYASVRSISKYSDDEQILAGTRQCMALEILMKHYMYYNSKIAPDTRASNLSHADFVAESQILEQSKGAIPWDFHSNAMHDLEPFLWMVLWFLFYRVPQKPKKEFTALQLHNQMDVGYNIFEDTSTQVFGQPSPTRSQCLTIGAEGLETCLKAIPEDFQDAGLQNCVLQLAKHVIRCYINLEGVHNFNGAATPSLLTQLPDWVYDGFESIFDIYLMKFKKNTVPIVDAFRPPVVKI